MAESSSIVIDDVEFFLGPVARKAGVDPSHIKEVQLVLGDGRTFRIETTAQVVMRPDEWLTREEVQKLLKLSRSTVEKLLASGELAGVKLGRQWRIKRSAVERLMTPSDSVEPGK